MSREMLDMSLVFFPTRRELGKGWGAHSPLGQYSCVFAAHDSLPVGRGWGIAEVIVTLRETSRGSDVLV